MKIFTSLQAKIIDNYTILNEPISSLNLMERAAMQCVHWIMQHHNSNQCIRIFAGCGNNGGDGLAIARLLIDLHISVEVYLIKISETRYRYQLLNLVSSSL